MPRLHTLKSGLKPLPSGVVKPIAAQVERKRGTTGVNDRNKIKARDCGLCQECKRKGRVRAGADVDHIIPLHLGGSDEESNKELLCKPCHDDKSKREAAERTLACGRQ